LAEPFWHKQCTNVTDKWTYRKTDRRKATANLPYESINQSIKAFISGSEAHKTHTEHTHTYVLLIGSGVCGFALQ